MNLNTLYNKVKVLATEYAAFKEEAESGATFIHNYPKIDGIVFTKYTSAKRGNKSIFIFDGTNTGFITFNEEQKTVFFTIPIASLEGVVTGSFKMNDTDETMQDNLIHFLEEQFGEQLTSLFQDT